MLETAGVRLTVENLSGFTADMNRASRSVSEFERSGSSVSRSLGSTSRAFSDAQRSAGGFGNTIVTQARVGQTGFSNLVSGVVGGSARLVSALAPLAAGVALTGLASSAINTRVTFERELANVGALARATEGEVEQLSAQAEALGASTAFSATDVLGGQQFLAVAGFEVPEIIEALPGLLATASASQADLATTSDIVSNALSGFNLAASETGRVSDVLVAGLTGSNTDLQQLGTALSFAAPNAAALGVTIEETAGAIGLLSNAGIQGSRAGTTLRGILQRLASPTGEAATELERLGINAFDAQGQFKALPDVISEFERGLDGLNDQQRADSINTIVGTIAGTGFTALLAAGSDELRAFTTELENSGGVAEEVAGRQLDNLAGDITRVSSAYEGLQLAVTRRATPALRGFLNNAVLPGITGLTGFIETLNDGGGALQAVAVGLSSLDSSAFQFDDDLFQIELGDIFSGEIDFSSAIGRFSINDFIDGQLDLGIGDTTQRLRIGDLIDLSIVSADDFIQLDINEVITGTYDVTSGFGTFNINDFIVGTFDFGVGDTAQRLKIGDILDFSLITADDFAELNINDVITGTYDITSGFGTFNINDFIVGTFDFGVGNRFNSLTIGDFFEFTSEDVSSIFSDATANITKLTIGDFIDLAATSGPAGSTIDINKVIVGTYDLANNITTVSITDVITGTLDFDTGQGSVTLGEDLTFEFDLGALQNQIQGQLTSLQNSILGTSGGFEAGTFVPPTAGIASRIQDSINDALSGDFTFELPAIGSQLQLAVDAAFGGEGLDFSSLSGGLDALGESLSGLDAGIAGATGEGGALASFVTLINEQIGGLATTLDSVDSGAVGDSLTGVITSLTSVFTQLNTIDDLALGGIAGSLSDLTTSILNFASGIAAGVDADAVGKAAADSAAVFISSFQAVLSEPDLPAISGAAAGLVAGIGEQLRTAFEPGNFTVVGASLGQLAQTIVDQLTSTLSDPEIGASIGSGFADILIGVTQGLVDVRDGAASELEGSGGELQDAVQVFTGSLITALSDSLAEADYGSIAQALVGGIVSSVTGALTPDPVAMSGVISTDRFAGEELPQELFSLPELPSFPAPLADFLNAGADIVGFDGSTLEGITGASDGVNELSSASSALTESTSAATESLTELAAAQSAVAESAPEPGLFNGFLNFFGLGGETSAPIEEARRTGIGTGAAFDEADIAGSIQDQIATQLNFGDLPETISTAATDAIAAAIPAESLIDSELITSTLTEAVTAAIPAEPVIDADTVNDALLTAAQEAIPPSEVPAFPGWQQVLDFRAPTIPRFPSWRQVLDIRVPRIPGFPGWSSFINFDIPSIPSFPGWAALTGLVDLATLVPPFPGWASLINVDIRVPNVSCELACSGGGGGGGSSGGSSGGGSVGGGGGGAGFSPLFTGTTFFQGGLALVSERGDEIIVPPSGAPFIARGEQFLNLDPGTQVIDASQSQRLLNGDTAPIGGQSVGAAAQGSVVSGAGLSGRAAAGFAVASGELDEQSLASGIVESFKDAFNLPNFPGWRATLGAPDIRLPPFPGWSSIVGLENISVSIFRTENIITQEETSNDDGGRDIEIGPIVPISFSAGVGTIESEASSATTETSGGAGSTAGRGISGIGSALFSTSSIMASSVQSTAGNLMQSPPSVTNVTNNTNVENNFNLTTESLRSSESVNADFAMMERLASVSGVI